MKITAAIVSSLLAVSAAAFDKNQPWGKRDYPCINVFQGLPDNATVGLGDKIEFRWNRNPTSHCPDPLCEYPGSDYKIVMYNNPQLGPSGVTAEQTVILYGGIKEEDGKFRAQIPKSLPDVKDDSLWYLRIETVLETAPQMPSLFNAAGPFTVTNY
ncbi:hypothetical protein CNMCM8980_007959 [Aspergillus fumigatiaffinis]|uniref:Uncharacterized protein n=1 Tax=Aspergillus fumigatiaffinis TaxID=340414 RepID=A0A8H4M5X1_9EURO|nr:hypothetical protein CNMCM5878_006640 [Aspergillus fumigatiaffinis]KAF4230984.1 hypothetical protein CNMCM6805_000507 [Aspergillus fumigatiaffinis]KAF4231795.1 hypothetical protein CNMCM6457_005094 [Aspergillus fumigatiaffinis]KAF4246923.1 hypothetical protein CNMCM8980_007959 [Aspergillus fumigatiaffinis]